MTSRHDKTTFGESATCMTKSRVFSGTMKSKIEFVYVYTPYSEIHAHKIFFYIFYRILWMRIKVFFYNLILKNIFLHLYVDIYYVKIFFLSKQKECSSKVRVWNISYEFVHVYVL